MNNAFPTGMLTLAATLLLGGTVLVAGCRHRVNAFTDELAGQPPVSTPSVEAARAVSVERTVSRRPHARAEVDAASGAVTHGPLFFEDPFEDIGSEEGAFRWTGGDYGHFFYGPSRFLVNTVLFPVSAVVTPPWQVMVSDGQRAEAIRVVNPGEGDASTDGSTALSE